MLTSPLRPSFLDTYSQSSLGCKAMYIVIKFLVLWLISLSSYLDHFKNVPEFLQGELPLCLFLWWYFCSKACSREVFSFVYCYVIFFLPACLLVSASIIPKYMAFSFLQEFRFFLYSAAGFLPWFGFSYHFIMSMTRFLCQILFLYYDYIFFLFVSDYSFFLNSLMFSMYIRWLIFSRDFVNFFTTVFLSI